MLDIRVVSSWMGDWKGLYIDGDLVYENHDIPLRELLENLKSRLPIVYDVYEELDEEELEHFKYSMPNRFDEIECYRENKR